MSWQRDFDAGGPRWEGHSALLAEEKRQQKFLEDIKSRFADKEKIPVDEATFKQLDEEIKNCHNQEVKLMELRKSASTDEQAKAIDSQISNNRLHYDELRRELRRLKQQGT